jgi:hypothetical protein
LAPLPTGPSLNAWMKALAAAIGICCQPCPPKPSHGPGPPALRRCGP